MGKQRKPNKRYDPNDGHLYTKRQFIECYGGEEGVIIWDDAKRPPKKKLALGQTQNQPVESDRDDFTDLPAFLDEQQNGKNAHQSQNCNRFNAHFDSPVKQFDEPVTPPPPAFSLTECLNMACCNLGKVVTCSFWSAHDDDF